MHVIIDDIPGAEIPMGLEEGNTWSLPDNYKKGARLGEYNRLTLCGTWWTHEPDGDVVLEFRPEGIVVEGWYEGNVNMGKCLIRWEELDRIRIAVRKEAGA